MTALVIVPPAPRPLPEQFADVAVLDEQGWLWAPNPDNPDDELGWHLFNGARIRWLPLDAPDRVLVQFLGGAHRTDEDRRDFQEEGFIAGFMRPDLRKLIEQLQAIDAQLKDTATC